METYPLEHRTFANFLVVKKNIAILASGRGSNALRFFEHFAEHNSVQIVLVASNVADAPVLDSAKEYGIETAVITKSNFRESDEFLSLLQSHQIDYIVLAGFLWLVPKNLVEAYPDKIFNIHPALLPSYGGKGMYGMNVHRAVKEAGEKESGMTIHYVNARYDEGNIIFQAKTTLYATDSAEEIAAKVLKLEHRHYAQVIDDLISAG